MARLSPKAKRNLLRMLVGIVLITLNWAAWHYWLKPWLFPPSPLVITPRLGLDGLESKSLYYNGEARLWLEQMRPTLLAEDDRGDNAARVRSFSQASLDPRLFRHLDRKYRFDTVLLLGDSSNYQRLLDHLIEPEPEKRDFRLVYLDHWMLVFKRGAEREWKVADLEPLRAKMTGLRSEDRAAFLAKTAERMLSAGAKDVAKQWLDEALKADSSSTDALAGLAGYYAILAKWRETDSYADKALAENPTFAPALQRKFLALVGTKYFMDAYKVSGRLLKAAGENPGLLRQHARIAHLAKQYDAEITALTRLIVLAEAGQRPTGEYEFALGEAHTFAAADDKHHAPRAAEHFRKALQDETLPEEMRKFAIERLATIAEKTGIQ